MRYFKTVKNGYILTIGCGLGGIEIAEEEYQNLHAVFMKRPAEEGICYDLRADTLEWEQTGIYTEDSGNSELTETEEKALAYDIITGVAE